MITSMRSCRLTPKVSCWPQVFGPGKAKKHTLWPVSSNAVLGVTSEQFLYRPHRLLRVNANYTRNKWDGHVD